MLTGELQYRTTTNSHANHVQLLRSDVIRLLERAAALEGGSAA